MEQLALLFLWASFCLTAIPAALIEQAAILPSTSTCPTFEQWMQAYGRVYLSRQEMEARASIYAQNAGIVDAHNSQRLGWTMGCNRKRRIIATAYTPQSFQTSAPMSGVHVSSTRTLLSQGTSTWRIHRYTHRPPLWIGGIGVLSLT